MEFSNDYNGFIYKYDEAVIVYTDDADGGRVEEIARASRGS